MKITDFGIAKSLPQTVDETRDTMTGVLVGTMKYMSPEQLRGRPPSPRWDLWALAVIAYEAICGCAPFVGEDSETLRIAILGTHFPPVIELLPDAPRRWQAFFEGAFAHEEEQRAKSVAEFWRELRNCLEGNVAS